MLIYNVFYLSIYTKENILIFYCKLPIPDIFIRKSSGKMWFRYTYAFWIKKKNKSKSFPVKYEDLSVHNSANFRVIELNSSDSGIDIIDVEIL